MAKKKGLYRGDSLRVLKWGCYPGSPRRARNAIIAVYRTDAEGDLTAEKKRRRWSATGSRQKLEEESNRFSPRIPGGSAAAPDFSAVNLIADI